MPTFVPAFLAHRNKDIVKNGVPNFFDSVAEYYKEHLELPKGVMGFTVDGKPLFSGALLFELKATHGFPLEFALDQIFSKGWAVDWIAFIETARKNLWWDYKTYDVIRYAFDELSDMPQEMKKEILDRFKIYVVKYRHPGMQE